MGILRNARQSGKVHVLGAGIAGLTAAHELAVRGYQVDVYERDYVVGGKAATQYPWLPLTGDPKDLYRMPAEHGFRLFPSFYRHLPDTMSRIPFQRSPNREPPPPPASGRQYWSVADNLLAAPLAAMIRSDRPPRIIPRAYGDKLGDFLRALHDISSSLHFSDASLADTQRFQLKCLQFITSCAERRDAPGRHSYGDLSWWQFLGADRFTARFQQEVDTFVRTMVAMDARSGNARTIGNVGMQLIFDLFGSGQDVDRVLNGPTSEQWLVPWGYHLANLSANGKNDTGSLSLVKIKYGHSIRSMTYSRAKQRVTHFEVEENHQRREVPVKDGECVIAALPIEVMKHVLSRPASDELVRQDSGLDWIRQVDLDRFTAWMVGIQFYLARDVPSVKGHVYYPETPWKLSSVSQAQFWGPEFHKVYGKGLCRGILSVDACDWEHSEGQGEAREKLGKECSSADEVAREIWEQLRDSHQSGTRSNLPDKYLAFHLDDSIQFALGISKGGVSYSAPDAYNRARYFIHPPGSHLKRPKALTSVENLFLAGDYVQTVTDLACMEGANESARAAVNGIIKRDDLDGDLCEMYPMVEPAEFDYAKKLDRDLFRRGQPHLFEILGINDRLERGSASAGSEALSLATTAIRGTQMLGSGLAQVISRVF